MTRYALFAFAVVVGFAAHARADELLIDGIAAQVGNDIVLVSEVMQRVGPLEAKMRGADAPAIEIAKLRAAGLEKLIEARLIEQIVRRAELYASDEEIDQAIDSIARENGITREQLEQSVVAQGMTFEQYRSQLKNEIESRKVIGAMVASKVHVEENEVRALYDERFSDQPVGGEIVHLRQILVTLGSVVSEDEKAACAPVREARDRIRGGEAFEKVAAEISEVAPAQGGDIGWLHTDSLASWMADVVGSLQDGETSEVIELPFGCSLLKIVERREFELVTYEEAKEPLQIEIYEQHLDEAFRDWMEDLRARTFIERKGHFADAAMLGSKSGFAEEGEDEEDSRF
jgi:peptidyl-prolyl cis-trans isomerase SurA